MKIDLTPAIIELEKIVMNIDRANSLMNIQGKTPTEIQIAEDKFNKMKEPYIAAIKILKIQNHDFTPLDRGLLSMGTPLSKIIKGL